MNQSAMIDQPLPRCSQFSFDRLLCFVTRSRPAVIIAACVRLPLLDQEFSNLSRQLIADVAVRSG